VAGGNVAPAAPPTVDQGAVKGESSAAPGLRLVKSHSVARVIKRGLRYRVSCETRCRVTSVLRIQGQRLGKSSARRVSAGHSRAIVLKLDRSVRRNLVTAMRKAHVRNLRATLVLRITSATGTKSVRRVVVLRR
jgi:hypothetical protein